MTADAPYSIISSALGIPLHLSGVTPSLHLLDRLQSITSVNTAISRVPPDSVILEAEMVAYNEDIDDIDEFANLHLCAEPSKNDHR